MTMQMPERKPSQVLHRPSVHEVKAAGGDMDALERKFGRPGVEEMAHLEDESEKCRAELEANPKDTQAIIRYEIAEKRRELFYAEHDSAGAFKFKKFGREVQEWFEPSADEPPILEASSEGNHEYELAEGQEGRHLMAVNMGELDRFNKEGGHSGGDAVLAEASRVIENVVREKLAGKTGDAANYQLYRFSGNEFVVSFDSISGKDFAALQEAINAERPGIPGVQEPAPLTAVGLSIGQAVEIMNLTQGQLTERERPLSSNDAARELIYISQDLLNHRLEEAKFKTRVARVLEIIRDQPAEAQALFDNYFKKTFTGSGLDSLGDFALLSKMESGAMQEEIQRMAETSAWRRFTEQRKHTKIEDAIVNQRYEARRFVSMSPRAPSVAPAGEGGLAQVPERTAGQEALRKLESEMETAIADERDPEEIELVRLDYQIEAARRDKGTGLFDRGTHYESLERAIEDDKDTAVVFVDMGFLKYFDQKGGRECGNGAVTLAADIMERAVAAAGVKGNVFRYGGDEFTIQVEGGKAAAEKVMAEVARLRIEAGRMPSNAKSKEEYAPTELVFNAGYCDRELLNAVFADLVEAGRYTDEELQDVGLVLNSKAELMTKIADAGIEREKAVSRFQQLIAEMRSDSYAQDGLRRRQVGSMVDFSNKALFSEIGGRDMLMTLANDRGLDGPELDRRIREFVDQKLAETHRIGDSRRDLFDRVIESHSKIQGLTEELARAESRIDAQAHEIETLKRKLADAQQEKRLLIETRGKMDQAYGG